MKKENAVARYFRETRAELRKVNWPSRQETWRLTQIVLIVTIGMALFLGLLDTFFTWWVEGVLQRDALRIGLVVVLLAAAVVVGVILDRQRE